MALSFTRLNIIEALPTSTCCSDVIPKPFHSLISALNEKKRFSGREEKSDFPQCALYNDRKTRREGRNWLKLLEHENIIEIYDTGSGKGSPDGWYCAKWRHLRHRAHKNRKNRRRSIKFPFAFFLLSRCHSPSKSFSSPFNVISRIISQGIYANLTLPLLCTPLRYGSSCFSLAGGGNIQRWLSIHSNGFKLLRLLSLA